MARGTREKSMPLTHTVPVCVVPAGAPHWVTPELLTRTIEVWQPYYADSLTADDALGMILNVGNLFAVLSERDHREAVRSTGPSQQP